MKNKTTIDNWFKNHKAKLTMLEHARNPIVILDWRDPNSSNYAVYYIIRGGLLIVHGDLGEATYRWSDALSFDWLSKVDLGYFHSKATASEHGRSTQWHDWDENKAITRIVELKQDRIASARPLNELITLATGPRGDFNDKIHQLYNDGHIISDLASTLTRCGEVIPLHCEAHLRGIQLAMEQVDAQIQRGYATTPTPTAAT